MKTTTKIPALLLVVILGLIAPLKAQPDFMAEYVSPEIVNAVTDFDSVSSNAFQLQGNKSNFQFYFQFEDGPKVWFVTGYDRTLKNTLSEILTNRVSAQKSFYYNPLGYCCDKVNLSIGSKVDLVRCLIKWGKIIDVGLINNNAQEVSLLKANQPIALLSEKR